MSSVDAKIIREALEWLYEPAALAASALARALPGLSQSATPLERAQQLRRLLLGAIASLQPTTNYVFGSIRSRSYDVLNLRYVEGTAIADIAEEIGITERQVYRDLQHARDELAALLSDGAPAGVEPEPQPAATEALLNSELAAFVAVPTSVSLPELLHSVAEITSGLATSLGRAVRFAIAEGLPRVSADEGILRQVLTLAFSFAIQRASGHWLEVSATSEGDWVCLGLSFSAPPGSLDLQSLASVARAAQVQHITCELQEVGDGRWCLSLQLRALEQRKVLVVEDNPGAIQLYRRYLAQSEEWSVAGVEDARIAADVARHMQPAVIVLDIMMPRLDGWAVLRALKSQPETAQTPIIVCSIFDDTPLARSLGASACLKKPVSQADFIACLKRCLPPRT